MNAQLLTGLVSEQSIAKIHGYLYPPIDSNFIKRKIKSLVTLREFTPKFWEFMVRDSRDVKIQFDRETVSWNFAGLLLHILKQNTNAYNNYVQHIEQFCIQAIKNNPKILFNHYHAGMGPGPAYQLITDFLQSRTVFCTSCKFKEIQPHLFNVFKFFMEAGYLREEYQIQEEERDEGEGEGQRKSTSNFWYHEINLRIEPFVTSKTAETLDLIFSHMEKLMTLEQKFNYNCHGRRYISNRIYDLLRIQCGQVKRYEIQSIRDLEARERYFEQDFLLTKATFWKVLENLNSNHPVFLKLAQKQLSQALAKQINSTPEFILQLFQLPNLANLLLKDEFLCNVFKGRKMKIISLIMSNAEFRARLATAKFQGKNVLEHACDSFGLSFNVIELLWELGYFKEMPFIRNIKSRRIILEKYRLQQNNI